MPIEGWDAFMAATQELSAATGGGGGMIQAEDGSFVPPSFFSGGGMTPAQRFSAQPDNVRFANMDSRPSADPGMAWAEDGTQVPSDYWD
ncbi:MAG: hypothetical protein CYG60_07065 [Actinobacteria bacterium]|nr:MAG: hypothetical protein CYG60_07065 [Actinomycetota bacterium]